MRRIAHLSDLHFGAEEARIAEGLLDDLASRSPDLVVVSGDLTQRARRHQFLAARAFLDRIAAPRLVVPGNHDIPLYNLAARVARPYAEFERAFGDDLEDCLERARHAAAWFAGELGDESE